MNKRRIAREVFERYGYIDLVAFEPENKAFQTWLKKNLITMKKLRGSGMYDEYRYTGPYSLLFKMVVNFWDEDEEFMNEYFWNIRRKT